MDGTRLGSVHACNSTGSMKRKFLISLTIFLAHVKSLDTDTAILILDSHLLHTQNLNVVLNARQNYVVTILLPPMHKLQQLDIGVMYPFSAYHS